MTKVYDMLGLYAQDLGGIRRLSARYNYQNEMEDYLIYWMQQDQLRGILRIDHTSSLRGAPEAYQEFQTESYMREIRQEIDESLLQATRAEVNLGKLFLAQRGIERDMIGHWGYASIGKYAAHLASRQIDIPTDPTLLRTGVDSGYASATITPDKCPLHQEAGAANDADPLTKTLTTQQAVSRTRSKIRIRHRFQHQNTPLPVKFQQAEQHRLAVSDNNVPSPADDASPVGSSGRSRRSVRRTSRYDEAITELKLRGSCGDGDSDYNVSDEKDHDSEDDEPPVPSPRLRITSDRRIIGLPAATPRAVVNEKPSDRALQLSHDIPPQPHSDVSRALPTSLHRTALPLPLPRVIVRPPKPIPKPKQPNTITHAQVAGDPNLNRFQQSLLGMPKGNHSTTSLLHASERETAKATPWITPQIQDRSDGISSSVRDQRRHFGTTNAPAFSPITERFPGASNQEHQGSAAAVYSLPVAYRSKIVDLTAEDVVMESPDPATPRLNSTPAISELYRSTGNDRTIVTETGSPVPARQGPSGNKPPILADNVVSTKTTSPTTYLAESNAPLSSLENEPALKSTPKPTTLHRKLDPTTGNVIVDQQSPQVHPHTVPHTSLLLPPQPLTALQNAGTEVERAAADLKSAATKMTRSTLPATIKRTPEPPTKDVEETPLLAKARKSSVKAVSTPSSSQDGRREKRKYTKSETQRKKEALRKEKLERERREREVRMSTSTSMGLGMGMEAKGREGQGEVELEVEGMQAVEGG